ncbi:MAG: hypothetical protein NVSMB3_10120 [Acidobacteriaceae bacterium]
MSRSLASIAAALILSALPLCSSTSLAQAHFTYLVSIPFDFHMNDKVMPAGSYEIVPLSPHTMRFRAMGSKVIADLLVYPTQEPGTVPSGQLRFARYGNLNFLREFSPSAERTGPHSASRCVKTPGEKQAARNLNTVAKAAAQQPTEIAINATPQR